MEECFSWEDFLEGVEEVEVGRSIAGGSRLVAATLEEEVPPQEEEVGREARGRRMSGGKRSRAGSTEGRKKKGEGKEERRIKSGGEERGKRKKEEKTSDKVQETHLKASDMSRESDVKLEGTGGPGDSGLHGLRGGHLGAQRGHGGDHIGDKGLQLGDQGDNPGHVSLHDQLAMSSEEEEENPTGEAAGEYWVRLATAGGVEKEVEQVEQVGEKEHVVEASGDLSLDCGTDIFSDTEDKVNNVKEGKRKVRRKEMKKEEWKGEVSVEEEQQEPGIDIFSFGKFIL